jgi:hypothetical protein
VTPSLSLLVFLAGTKPSSLSRQEDDGQDEVIGVDEETSIFGTYREHAAETIILIVALVIIALVMLGYLKA